jgi:hypothetical protein
MAVRIAGNIVSLWSENPMDSHTDSIDISLADIPTGPAPDLTSLPLFTPPVMELPPTVVPSIPEVPVSPVAPITPEPPKLEEDTDIDEAVGSIESPHLNPGEKLTFPELIHWVEEFRTGELPPVGITPYPLHLYPFEIFPHMAIEVASTGQLLLSSVQRYDGDSQLNFSGHFALDGGLQNALTDALLMSSAASHDAASTASVPESNSLLLVLAAVAGLVLVQRKHRL